MTGKRKKATKFIYSFLWFHCLLNDDIRLWAEFKSATFFFRRKIYEHSQLFVYYTIKIIGFSNKNDSEREKEQSTENVR